MTRKQSSASLRAHRSDRIAIIGAACRLPGASDIESFVELLVNRRPAIGVIPASRGSLARGGVSRAALLGEISGFDPAFFGIAQREADQMDPQQRILLELAVEALEAAGIPRRDLAGSRTGVYIGIASSDYSRLQSGGEQPLDLYAGTGNALSIAANRISYWLDLAGPSLALDTACSSSLNAIHLALRALRCGEIELALVGGVNLLLAGDLMEIFANARMLSPDGACKTFDAAADGYVRGEGAAVVVLRRADDALAAADRVLALIAGSASNQDGRSNGLTAPSGPAQVAVIEAALADAGLSAADIDAVELHGTGTPLGDPIEAQALAQALRAKRGKPLLVGSVKTNIGHLEAAAGIAGLLKATLALRDGELPASLNFHQANPQIDLAALDLRVVTSGTSLATTNRPARIGVSSFGFGGSNAHVILESAPPSARSPRRRRTPAIDGLLPVSAADPVALRQLAERYAEWIERADFDELADLLYGAAIRRDHLDHRILVCGDGASLIAGLRAAAAGQAHPALYQGRRPAAGARKLALLGDTGRSDLAGAPVERVIDLAAEPLDAQLAGRWDLLALGAPTAGELPSRIRLLVARDAVHALALLYVHGHELDWSKIVPPGRWRGLPSYPWQRRRCWFSADADAPADRAADAQASDADTYRIEWRALAPAATATIAGGEARRWLLVGTGAIVDALRQRLAEVGEQVGVVALNGQLEQRRAAVAAALAEPGAPWHAVVHLEGLHPGTAAAPRFLAGLATTQALLAGELPTTRLYLITRGAQAVGGQAPTDPSQAVLTGLARTIASEAPRLLGAILDLSSDGDSAEAEAARLCDLIGAAQREPELAWRDGQWWLPRLLPATLAACVPPCLREDAVYLVTGAFGGLGQHLLPWLIERGARRIALFGRHSPHAQARSLIDALGRDGVRIHSQVCDVADRQALVAAINAAEASLQGRIAGVVHAAGSYDGAMLASMTAAQVDDVFGGKIDGALHLQHALSAHVLDLFVLISSAAASFGMPGNGNYNAANAVLDALAAQRRAAGQAGLAIGPAPITGVGMETKAPASLRERWRQIGIQPLAASDLLRVIGRSGDTHHRLVLPIDWRRATTAFGAAIPALLSDQLQPFTAPPQATTAGWREAFAGQPIARRADWLEQQIGALLATVLRLPSGDRPEPTLGLQAQGMDSLMALEFHERLQQASGLRLPATLALETPSLRGLAGRLAPLLDGLPTAPPKPVGPALAARPPSVGDDDRRQLWQRVATLDDQQAWQQLTTAMEAH